MKCIRGSYPPLAVDKRAYGGAVLFYRMREGGRYFPADAVAVGCACKHRQVNHVVAMGVHLSLGGSLRHQGTGTDSPICVRDHIHTL